jgi:alcohol dehydrogenase class IV
MAVSGTDALAHSIESIWNVNATKLSLLYATQALKLIWNNLPNAVLHRDKDAMQKIAIGSNLAGRAINLTKTTAPHALSYGFTQLLGLPHGHSVALSLPYFLELHDKVNEKNCNSPNGVEHVQIAMDTIDNIISYRTNENALNVFFEHIGVKTSLKELGGNEFIYKEVIEGVNIERLSNNPVKLNRKDLLNYYVKS